MATSATPDTKAKSPAATSNLNVKTLEASSAQGSGETVTPHRHDDEGPSTNGSAQASDNDGVKREGERPSARASSSIKKPASFKAVSVNKTFLASKTVGNGNSPAKPADKSPGIQSTAGPNTSTPAATSRPRLVAKAGSSSAVRVGGKPAAVPDPNAVWNKNRPVPVPDTKAMTDEELRKKYGIHMAARLHTDESKANANNWADEDDDDEWVPDTISWADGTKTAIPHPDETLNTLPLHPSSPNVLPSHPIDLPTPAVAPPSGSVFPGIGGATSLVNPSLPTAKHSSLPGRKGLVLKSGPEKPTLVAKPPPPPAPVKSPWATLPPIDKASPVEPPLPHTGMSSSKASRFQGHGPKEIAADDFSRASWREGAHASTSRELFNSHSGRYEPTSDRRALPRNDSQPRLPSVLQRPSQVVHQTEGPAEPSAAFQTSRTSSHDAPYSRRRTSSNVSGGSGYLHRITKEHIPPLMPGDALTGIRRDSHTAVGESLESPRMHSGHTWQQSPRIPQSSSYQQPASSEPRPGVPDPAASSSAPSDTEVDFQRRIMREKRELAMKRRLEQEAKEEAERKERIRLKLEALGPAPERHSVRKEKEKEAAAKEAGKRQASVPIEEAKILGSDPTGSNLAGEQLKHGPELEAEPEASREKSLASAKSQQQPASTPGTLPLESATAPVPQTVPRREEQGGSGRQSHTTVTVHPTPPGDEKRQPHTWNKTSSSTERYTSWGPTATSRIWGAPNNDRSLGNGTFTSEFNGPVDDHITGHSRDPGPIAPPGPGKTQTSPPKSSDEPNLRPGPIAPPTKSGHFVAQPTDAPRLSGLDAWRSANVIQQQDRAIALDSKRRFDEHVRSLEARGMTLEHAQAPIQDTWKAVDIRNDGTRSEVRGVDSVAIKTGDTANSSQTPDTNKRDTPPSIASSIQPAASRASRFFPTRDREVGKTGRLPTPVLETEHSRTESPSPPPPTMIGHPAYDGDTRRPHVSFPPQRPVVKLPPSAAPSVHASRVTPSRHSAAPKSPENAIQEKWQDKINNLLGQRKPTAAVLSPVRQSFHVDSASKYAFDQTGGLRNPANVVLPTAPTVTVMQSKDEGSYTTKAMDEDCFEEQEMGSLPPVRIPRKFPEAALLPLPTLHIRTPRSYRLFASTSKDDFTFEPDRVRRVFLLGMKEAKQVAVPALSQPVVSRHGRGGRSGGRGSSSASRRGGGQLKARDAPASGYPPSQRSNSHRSRGGTRFNNKVSDSWPRRPSSQAQVG